MKTTEPQQAVTCWHCDCRKTGMTIPLTVRKCPRCGKQLPHDVKAAVYRQVLQELRQDALAASAERWKKYALASSRKKQGRRVWMVLLSVAWLALLIWLRADMFEPLLSQIAVFFLRILKKAADLAPVFSAVFDTVKRIPLPEILERVWELLCAVLLWVQKLYSHIADLISLIISYLS